MKNLITPKAYLMLALTYFLLSNFSAFAQKTNIWIVRIAEPAQAAPGANSAGASLSDQGLERAVALARALKREKISTIYIPPGAGAQQTAYPLSEKVKLLPRVYNDSIGGLVKTLNRNFQGTNVLVVAQLKDILPLINQLGIIPPFDVLNNEDYDLLFAVTIYSDDKRELSVNYFGKGHHVTEIPQQFLIEKFYPSYIPPVSSH